MVKILLQVIENIIISIPQLIGDIWAIISSFLDFPPALTALRNVRKMIITFSIELRLRRKRYPREALSKTKRMACSKH